MRKLSEFFSLLQQRIFGLIHFIFVFAFYFLGIGATRIASLFIAKSFLTSRYQVSSWLPAKKRVRLEKQY